MLHERFKEVDFNQVKNDASRFLFNKEDLSYYSFEFFDAMVEEIK